MSDSKKSQSVNQILNHEPKQMLKKFMSNKRDGVEYEDLRKKFDFLTKMELGLLIMRAIRSDTIRLHRGKFYSKYHYKKINQ